MIQLVATRLRALVVFVLVSSLAPALAEERAGDPREGEELEPRYVDWLAEVDPIISLDERHVFLQLKKDYQRDAFIRRFWQVRDPFPETGRNELRERWEERVSHAKATYGDLADDRSRILLVHGEPDRVVEVRCTTTRVPAEVWLYLGSEQIEFRFLVVFLRQGGLGPARIWRPGVGQLDAVIGTAGGCINGYVLRDVVREIHRGTTDYGIVLDRILAKPKPRNVEWAATFASYTTDLPEQASSFDAATFIDYLGRHQQRSVLQGVVQIPVQNATAGDFGGYRSYDFVLTGEIVLDSQLFESFRYKFGFPFEDFAHREQIPLAFQRYLRPGLYQLILKLEDLHSGRFYRHEAMLDVPKLEQDHELPPPTDPEIARLFSEATASVATGDTGIRIVPPSRDLQTGLVRIDTLATGEEIDHVVFFVDDSKILQKNRPPFNVELDLGDFPRLHRLRAEALDAGDRIVARDELLLNAGSHRFSVNLVEPRQGARYDSSLRARADVQIPEDSALERVEFYLNEELVATLYQEPWVQPIQLPGARTAYVRAVAYLTDGNTTEDLVFVNAPNLLEKVEVQFVELFASVYDREARPIGDLGAGDFHVLEDGIAQRVARFERVENMPIHVGILIDSSASMHEALDATRRAALTFLKQSIHPRDRAAIITFNRFPSIAVKMTNDITALGGGLAGLTAEGQTALYDSVMFALYYFTGVTGQRAILLLSDGKDEVSRFSFEETLEYARRAGVTIYSIGLGISEAGARRKLTALAHETGGQSYFLPNAEELHQIYEIIQQELRSQYLIAYQSNNATETDEVRRVELRVDRPGAVVKTMSGYYP